MLATMDAIEPRGVRIPVEDLIIRTSRSSGPGGQNVNKRSTKVEIVFDVTGSTRLGPTMKARALSRLEARLDAHGRLHVTAQAGRTQGENRVRALERLEGLLADAFAPPARARRPTTPTRGSTERRLADKRARAQRKRDRSGPRHDD